jgi:predicted metal-binding transcription factor (methanogenesis marker protein 9)
MDSKDLARYIEENNGISKPWLLMQLRLKKLEENRVNLSPEEYMSKLEELHQDLMNLGEWWKGIEDEVFNS